VADWVPTAIARACRGSVTAEDPLVSQDRVHVASLMYSTQGSKRSRARASLVKLTDGPQQGCVNNVTNDDSNSE